MRAAAPFWCHAAPATGRKSQSSHAPKQIYDLGYRRMVGTLKATRKAHGLTQAEVAATLGVCRTWVSKVESCEVGLDLLDLLRLCRVYGLKTATAVQTMEKA